MTVSERMYRRMARRSGLGALNAIRFAVFPVYDGDTETWTDAAIRHACNSWRYAWKAFEHSDGAVPRPTRPRRRKPTTGGR